MLGRHSTRDGEKRKLPLPVFKVGEFDLSVDISYCVEA